MSTNSVKAAYDHIAAGRPAEAVALLEKAGGGGDATAWAELATWYLRGDLIRRDLFLARAALRRAVTVGHVDAALLEVALVANGTGGAEDWPMAVNLLRKAAENDPVAARQRALLSEMLIDDRGYPMAAPTPEILSNTPFVARYSKSFSQAECLHVAGIVHGDLQPGVVVDPKTGRHIQHPIRNSYGATIGPAQEDLVVSALNRRLATLTNTELSNGEPLQVLRYSPGQQYHLHSDALSGMANQRSTTAITYLNEGFSGGETDFPEIGVRVQPRAGDTLVFHNVLADGTADRRVRHAGLPVTNGVKWIATRWIRIAAYDPWTSG